MDKNNDAAWEECLKTLSELPPKRQRAFAWLLDNFEIAIEMCKSTNLTATEIEAYRQKASESGDTVLELLLILKGVLDSQKDIEQH